MPDPTLTPGVVRTTNVADVCSHDTNQLRHMTRERRDGIMAEYGCRAVVATPTTGSRSELAGPTATRTYGQSHG